MKNLMTAVIILFLPLLVAAQEQLPPLNQKVIDYVETTIGDQVNRGECWDLAYEALERHNAVWDKQYKYGKLYNPKKETVYPGDFIQFKDVEVQYRKGNTIFTETMAHHTAVVFRVIDQKNKVFELAHQNTNFSGRKVGLSELDLRNITRGKLMFYRPVPQE
jgi:hypothetical protein